MDANEPGLDMDELTMVPAAGTSKHTQRAAGSMLPGSESKGYCDPDSGGKQQLRLLDLNYLLVHDPCSTFLFRVRGEQGVTQGIRNGDLAVVDRGTTPRAQDLILWQHGKRFYLSRPTRIGTGIKVWGTITAVIHQYRTISPAKNQSSGPGRPNVG